MSHAARWVSDADGDAWQFHRAQRQQVSSFVSQGGGDDGEEARAPLFWILLHCFCVNLSVLFCVCNAASLAVLTLVSPLFPPRLQTGFWTQKSRSWLQWAAGGCFSPTAVACPAPRRCRRPGAHRVSRTWGWASSLSGCPDGTDPGAVRTQTHTHPPPSFSPVPHPVSTKAFELF